VTHFSKRITKIVLSLWLRYRLKILKKLQQYYEILQFSPTEQQAFGQSKNVLFNELQNTVKLK